MATLPVTSHGPRATLVLLSQAAAGTALNVTVGYGDKLLSVVDNDATVDITRRIAKDIPKSELDDWLPSRFVMVCRNGRQCGLPKYTGTSAFSYNSERRDPSRNVRASQPARILRAGNVHRPA